MILSLGTYSLVPKAFISNLASVFPKYDHTDHGMTNR